jgi:hypothetical protein
MANYCSNEDVAVLIGYDNFSSLTRPTSTQVTSIITDITNEIDFVLASIGVTTQPTDTRLLGGLAIACKYGAACQVAVSGYGNAQSIDGSQGDKFCEKYKEILDDIKENPELYGTVTGDSTMFLSNQVTDGTYTETNIDNRYISEDFVF